MSPLFSSVKIKLLGILVKYLVNPHLTHYFFTSFQLALAPVADTMEPCKSLPPLLTQALEFLPTLLRQKWLSWVPSCLDQMLFTKL